MTKTSVRQRSNEATEAMHGSVAVAMAYASRKGTLLAVVPMVVLPLAACEQGPSNDGPLTVGSGEGAHLCLDVTEQERAAGVTYVSNTSQREVTITSVDLIDWNGAAEYASFVIPDGPEVYAVGQIVPAPDDDPTSAAAWALKEPAVGQVITPGTTYQVVVTTSVLLGDSFEGIRVAYTSDQGVNSGRNHTSASVQGSGDDCASS